MCDPVLSDQLVTSRKRPPSPWSQCSKEASVLLFFQGCPACIFVRERHGEMLITSFDPICTRMPAVQQCTKMPVVLCSLKAVGGRIESLTPNLLKKFDCQAWKLVNHYIDHSAESCVCSRQFCSAQKSLAELPLNQPCQPIRRNLTFPL